jgi:hypothetical protein
VIVPDNPVSHYRFGEARGTTVNDEQSVEIFDGEPHQKGNPTFSIATTSIASRNSFLLLEVRPRASRVQLLALSKTR